MDDKDALRSLAADQQPAGHTARIADGAILRYPHQLTTRMYANAQQRIFTQCRAQPADHSQCSCQYFFWICYRALCSAVSER